MVRVRSADMVMLGTGMKLEAPARPPKYRNTVTYVDGKRFASKREAERYQALVLKERAGQIMNLRLHTRWPLIVNGLKIADYEDDFNYSEILAGSISGGIVVEDAKGVRTPVYRLKKKLMKALHNIDVREV